MTAQEITCDDYLSAVKLIKDYEDQEERKKAELTMSRYKGSVIADVMSQKGVIGVSSHPVYFIYVCHPNSTTPISEEPDLGVYDNSTWYSIEGSRKTYASIDLVMDAVYKKA